MVSGRYIWGPVERACTIPAGVSLLFPILNVGIGDGQGDCNGIGPFRDPTLKGCDEPGVWAGLVAFYAAATDNPRTLEVTIDGHPLGNLIAYRAQAPQFPYTMNVDNILGVYFGVPRPRGLYFPAGSDGYWVMLKALDPGQHTIRFKDAFGPGAFDGFGAEATYHLTVRRGADRNE